MLITSGLSCGQVLQRLGSSANATIAGTCSANGGVTARVLRGRKPLPGWSGKKVGTAADGTFQAKLTKLPVGGPYRVELAVAGERLVVEDIFVGDVWIMAGQSNMEGIGELADAPKPHPLAHCLHTDGVWRLAEEPLHLLHASPDRCHTETTIPWKQAHRLRMEDGRGTSVGLWFARHMLARDPKVPQGLIACAHGGTSMAQWDPAQKALGGGSMYGSMLRLWGLTGQPVAGILWYQGESDCSAEAAPVYTAKMEELVAATRRDLGLPKLAWLVVQIGQVVTIGDHGKWWESIREQQRLLPGRIPRLAVVAGIDLTLDDGIHIGGAAFDTLGQRLARQAARVVLGDRRERPDPVPLGVRLLKQGKKSFSSVIELRCREVVDGWKLSGHGHGFSVINAAGTQLPLVWRVRPAGNNLHLYVDHEVAAQAEGVIYGPGLRPFCDITDGRGSALPGFGPFEIAGVEAKTGFLPACQASEIQAPVPSIADLPFPAPGALPSHALTAQTSPAGFMSEHARWQGHAGWAAFHFNIDCADQTDCDVRFGYDGPFRLAIDGRELHRDMKGTNPALADTVIVRHRFTTGRHQACVLMDLNGGHAWGFWFRISLPGVSPRQQRTQGPALPTFD